MTASRPLCAFAALLLAAAEAASAAGTLVVNDGGDDCGAPADHTTIQAAVDAAAASGTKRIRVCPGTYVELVSIEGFERLVLEGEPGARIEPPGTLVSGGIVSVIASRRVDVRGFEIDGAGRLADGPIHAYGIYLRDSSGRIEDNVVLDIRPEPLVENFTHAIHAVDTDPEDDHPVALRIRGNHLVAYGQMGIDVAGAASLRIEGNVLVGVGLTDAVAQYGIILREAERGRVAGNSISSHWYAPYRAATGLVLDRSSRVRVERNAFDSNDGSVMVLGAAHRNRIARNAVTGTRIAISVRGVPGTPAEGNSVTRNRLEGAGGAGAAAVEIQDAEGTRITRNEVAGFAAFVSGSGTETKLSHNTCDGAPCP